jgi:hypothetical protein
LFLLVGGLLGLELLDLASVGIDVSFVNIKSCHQFGDFSFFLNFELFNVKLLAQVILLFLLRLILFFFSLLGLGFRISITFGFNIAFLTFTSCSSRSTSALLLLLRLFGFLGRCLDLHVNILNDLVHHLSVVDGLELL